MSVSFKRPCDSFFRDVHLTLRTETVPKDYAMSVCNLFAQLGARGASIMFSSGDFGVGGGDCTTNDGKSAVKFQCVYFLRCFTILNSIHL